MAKTACIFGSTGLIGSHLLKLLLNNQSYSNIILFNRSDSHIIHPKLKQIVADYEQLEDFLDEIVANEYYCCLGTTIKKAKTKKAFEYVDYLLPIKIADIALKNGVEKYLVVSSIGASAKSSNFYLRTKGKMELTIADSGIKRVHFFRPSLLLGKRTGKRPMESLSKIFMKPISFFLIGSLRKYKAIHAKKVAAAMISVANSKSIQQVFISDEIEELGKSYLSNPIN